MTLAIGDRVAYSAAFLKAIGMAHSELARAQGMPPSWTVNP